MEAIKIAIIITIACVSFNDLLCMTRATLQRPEIARFGTLAAQRAAATTLPRLYSTGFPSSETKTPPLEPSSFDNQIRRRRATGASRFGSFGSFPRQSTSYFGSTTLRSQNFKRQYSANAFRNLGITKKSKSFEVLGVPTSASAQQVNNAYKKLAAKYHPDLHRGKTAEEMKIINEAKEAALRQIKEKKEVPMSFNSEPDNSNFNWGEALLTGSAAAFLANEVYQWRQDQNNEEIAKAFYVQNKKAMDELGFDEYWHTHEITDQALADIARKNFARIFINTYLGGEYNKESADKFQKKYYLTVSFVDENWLNHMLGVFDSYYSPIVNQLDSIQKSRDNIFGRSTSTPSLKDRPKIETYKEIARGLREHIKKNRL
jgi:hypothetical protein